MLRFCSAQVRDLDLWKAKGDWLCCVPCEVIIMDHKVLDAQGGCTILLMDRARRGKPPLRMTEGLQHVIFQTLQGKSMKLRTFWSVEGNA